MKLKEMKMVLMNLQLFTEGGEAGGSAAGEGTEGGASGESGDEPQTFDEILTNPDYQAEFDRRVQKALEDAEDKWTALADDKLTEAEKLAKMTKEEKAVYKAQKLERELAELKKQNALSDMAKTARKMLSDEGVNVPDELISNLIAEDASTTKTAVETFTKMYKAAVQEAVKDALKGKPPKAGSSGDTVTREQILAIKNPAERQRMIAQNITLFQ